MFCVFLTLKYKLFKTDSSYQNVIIFYPFQTRKNSFAKILLLCQVFSPEKMIGVDAYKNLKLGLKQNIQLTQSTGSLRDVGNFCHLPLRKK